MSWGGETFRYNALDMGTRLKREAHYNIQYSSSNGGSVSIKLVRHFPSELSNIHFRNKWEPFQFSFDTLCRLKSPSKLVFLQIVFAFKRQTSKTKLSGSPWIVFDNWSLNISFSNQCHFFSMFFHNVFLIDF